MLEIGAGSTVKLSYHVKLEDGTPVDSSKEGEPLEFIVGESQIIQGLIDNVKGLKAGDRKSFIVEARQAYGEHSPELVKVIPRNLFPENIEINKGDMLAATNPDGNEVPFIILEASAESVTADFNHVLAGKNLHFDVEIIDVAESKLR